MLSYNESAHSFGEMEIGVQKVIIFIDVISSEPTAGQASDQTGIEIDGGGGIGDEDNAHVVPIRRVFKMIIFSRNIAIAGTCTSIEDRVALYVAGD